MRADSALERGVRESRTAFLYVYVDDADEARQIAVYKGQR